MKNFSIYRILILLVFLSVSCSSPREIIREVPVEVSHIEYQNKYIHDSIWLYDSIYMYDKGDTVYKEVNRTKYISRELHDTLLIHDTVPQIITQPEIIEKEVPQWWPVWLAFGTLLLFSIVYITYKIKK